MMNTIKNVATVVMELDAQEHWESDQPKKGPAISQTMTIAAANMNAQGLPD